MTTPFKLIMMSAMYENGGNTTHRLLDGHPDLDFRQQMPLVAQALHQAGCHLLELDRYRVALGEHHQGFALEVAHPAGGRQQRRQAALESTLQTAQPRGMVLQAGKGVAAAEKTLDRLGHEWASRSGL